MGFGGTRPRTTFSFLMIVRGHALPVFTPSFLNLGSVVALHLTAGTSVLLQPLSGPVTLLLAAGTHGCSRSVGRPTVAVPYCVLTTFHPELSFLSGAVCIHDLQTLQIRYLPCLDSHTQECCRSVSVTLHAF